MKAGSLLGPLPLGFLPSLRTVSPKALLTSLSMLIGTNAQSRALKGLPTTDAPAPEPPTWLAMHEFDEAVSVSELDNTPDAQNLLRSAKKVEKVAYRLVKALGSQWFHE